MTWLKVRECTRVGNFRPKNYSAEDGLDGTIGLFRRNSGCSAEQKTLGIPFRTIPWKRKMLEIFYSGTKIEANSRNFIPNHSAEEKNARNSVSCNKNRSNFSNSVPNHSLEEKTTRNSVPWNKQTLGNSLLKHLTTFEVRTNHFVKLFWLFLKIIFYCVFLRYGQIILLCYFGCFFK